MTRRMSTRTSRARAALALGLAAALLAACIEHQALSNALNRVATPGAGSVQVLDGAFAVAGPDGWCVDQGAVRETGDQAFVLLVPCQATRGAPILSVAISDVRVPQGDRAAQLGDLRDFLLGEGGRAQLSRRGNPAEVTVRSHRIEDGALWLELRDLGNPETVSADYGRVVLPLAGRLVTLSAMSLTANPARSAAAFQALQALIAMLRARNPD